MSLWRQLIRGIRTLVNRRASDDDVRAEVHDFLERATASHIRRGLSPKDALRAAQLELGNTTVAQEQVRSYGWENRIETLLADLRYALRRLRTNPAFTVVSVLTLALGIGATSTIFSAVHPILFAALPFPAAERLVTVTDVNDGGTLAPAFGSFGELHARARSYASLAALDAWRASLTGGDQPERLNGQRVSAAYFSTLGVHPAIGRDFSESEDVVDGPAVAIVSARLADRRLGGVASVVGRKVTFNDNEFTVIGVMPRDFDNVLSPAADVWIPLQENPRAPFNSREWGHHYRIVGRLAPGMTIDGAERETKAIGSAPTSEFPRPPWAAMTKGMLVRSLQDDVASDAKPTLLAIVGAAFLLLTIACVNVTNLLMARGAQRRSEFAMRLALGAGRRRLLGQLLTESLVLAGAGGALGLVFAELGIKTLVALSPAGLPRVNAIRLDGSVFVFALAATTIVGVLVGIVPALGASRAAFRDGLQQASRRTSGGTGFGRSLLVVAEVSLALVLLTGAGLLMHSLERLLAVATGFNARGVITMQVAETGPSSHSDTARAQFFENALDAVRHLPSVSAAAFTSQLPLSGDLDGYGYELPSKLSNSPGNTRSALRYSVTPDYFKVMGIPLLRGRFIDASDRVGSPEAIVVSESFAKRAFGGENPIGQRVRFGPEAGNATRPWDLVVGVVGDVKQTSLASDDVDAFYGAMTQWWWVDNVQSLVVRTTADVATLAPALKRAIWSVDANQPIQRVATMDRLVAASASQRRFALIVIETFAIAALLLAAIGMYGVISGSVAERTREIGIRAALGATPRGIVASVVGRGLSLAALGVLVGLGGAFAASSLLISLMFGTSRLDPATYGGVVALLGAVSAIACWIPASRAARVDPAITLRAE